MIHISEIKKTDTDILERAYFEDSVIKVNVLDCSEVRFGPSNCKINISRSGNIIWKDEKFDYSSYSFDFPFVSNYYHKVVLIKNIMYKTQPVVIDTISLEETAIADYDYYCDSGHFYSFNAVFYKQINDIDYQCYNLNTGEKFRLFERIGNNITNVYKWSVCPVNNCILLLLNSYVDNIVLYDLIENNIIGKVTMPLEKENSFSANLFLDKKNRQVIMRIVDSTKYIIKDYSISFD